MRRLPPCAATVAVVALSSVPAAAAVIVPGKSIAGARIGMTQRQVRARLGAPARVVHGRNDFGKFTELRYAGLVVEFQGNAAATSVVTTRASERTAGGAGAGSTEAALRARVHRLTCRTDAGFRHCYLGTFRPGTRVTDFVIRRGKVSRVTVGIVID
jgi:hypothetical protein